MKKFTSIVFVLMLALSACGHGKPITSGRITGKDYNPAEDGITMTIIPSCTSDGKSTICTNTIIPIPYHYDENWQFQLEQCVTPAPDKPEKCRRGWIYVSHETYGSYSLNDQYPS